MPTNDEYQAAAAWGLVQLERLETAVSGLGKALDEAQRDLRHVSETGAFSDGRLSAFASEMRDQEGQTTALQELQEQLDDAVKGLLERDQLILEVDKLRQSQKLRAREFSLMMTNRDQLSQQVDSQAEEIESSERRIASLRGENADLHQSIALVVSKSDNMAVDKETGIITLATP